jgi:REP element-mobilizing transposase RayT
MFLTSKSSFQERTRYAKSESALHSRLCWHITHRCHKKEFLLKFARDRRLWLQWLFEARKRYGLSVLNYMVTSNHIHPLVRDNGERDVISNSVQLFAGRMGQEYNRGGRMRALSVIMGCFLLRVAGLEIRKCM